MDQQIVYNPTVPTAPLLPQNSPGPRPPVLSPPPGNPMADFYGGHDPFADAKHATEDPQALAKAQAAVADSIKHVTIGDFESDLVELPIAVILGDKRHKIARVRELNGGDEERLGRAAESDQPETILDTLLSCGVVSIGDHTPNAADLLELAVPNRDALLLGIRKATYGDELKFEQLGCRRCDQVMEITYDLKEVPDGGTLQVGDEHGIKIPLRRGGYVIARFPNGGDQLAILGEIRAAQITRAEQDTLLLSKVITMLVDSAGQHVELQGLETARALSIPDRTAILRTLDERRPGPHLDAVQITCPWCEKETEVPMAIETLFRG